MTQIYYPSERIANLQKQTRRTVLQTLIENMKPLESGLNTFSGEPIEELLSFQYNIILNEYEPPSVLKDTFDVEKWSISSQKMINCRLESPRDLMNNLLCQSGFSNIDDVPKKSIARNNPMDKKLYDKLEFISKAYIVTQEGDKIFEESSNFPEDLEILKIDTAFYNKKRKLHFMAFFMYRSMRTSQVLTGFCVNLLDDPSEIIRPAVSGFSSLEWIDSGRCWLKKLDCSLSDFSQLVSEEAAEQWKSYTNQFQFSLLEMRTNLRLDDDHYWRDYGVSYQIEFLKKLNDLTMLYAKICLRASKYLMNKSRVLTNDLALILETNLDR
jgi:hypothetical protein